MNQFTAGVVAAWAAVLTFVPRLLAFLAILLIGYMVARAVAKLVDSVLKRLRFDNLVERGGIKSAMEQTGYEVSDILAKLAYYGIMLFTLELAFGVFGPNAVSDLLTRMLAYLPNVFVAVLIVVVAGFVANAIRELIQASLASMSYGRTLANLASGGILVVGVFAALSQLNIAPYIVNGLFYSLLAVVVGSAIVAIGGGGISPMRAQWERAISSIEQEAPRVRAQVASPNLRTERELPPTQRELDEAARRAA
jgi:hypothetical protein